MVNPPPEQGWISQVFDDAWRSIERDGTVIAAWECEALLEQSVRDAEHLLEKGLRIIQDCYKGGEPLV